MNKFIPLNLALMANPVNWLIVPLILLIGGLSFSLLVHGLDMNKTLGVNK